MRALDAVDLEQWLDRCPAVAAWAARQVAHAPDGACDLEEVWERWAGRTIPRLAPEVLTAGRAVQADLVRRWAEGSPALLRVGAETADEAVGFVAAVLQTLEPAARDRALARALVAATPDVWRWVTGQPTPVVVVAAAPFGAERRAVDRGHHILVAHGNDAAGVSADIRLSHLRRDDLEAALRGIGLGYERARDVAAESRGRVTALTDLLGGASVPPHWAAPASGPELVPLLLAGAWSDTPHDTGAVARLARAAPDDIARRLSQWANVPDPPVRLVAGVWEWVSRQRAWPHLARHVTSADLTAFRDVAADVLGEPDPSFDVPPDERWAAGLRHQRPRYSNVLRRGVAEGLVMLAAEPAAVRSGADPAGLVARVVRDLFGPAPCPARWYALTPVLRLLAEAAPCEFLAAVERDVVGDEAVRRALFREAGYFGRSPHCDLLWALETLAWAPEFLTEVVVALGGLTAADPIGRGGNRPAASLRTVLLPWSPQTAAPVAGRLAALDSLRRVHPAVAFDLGASLLPCRHDVATPTPRPRWRTWAADCDEEGRADGYFDFCLALYRRLLDWARGDGRRWARLLDPLPQADAALLGDLVDGLEAEPPDGLGDTGDALRRAVRHVLHRQRTVEGVYPELTTDLVRRFEGVYARLEPPDPVARHAWLFDPHPEVISVVGNDWEAEEAARHRERQVAIAEVAVADPVTELLRLADVAADPAVVGAYAGRSLLSDAVVAELLVHCLGAESEKRRGCGHGAAWERFRRDGWEWVHRLYGSGGSRNWPAPRTVALAAALPFAAATWDWLDAQGDAVVTEYWQTRAGWLGAEAADTPRAVRLLLAHGRAFTALNLVSRFTGDRVETDAVPDDLRLAVLRAVTAAARGEGSAGDLPRFDGGFGYHLGQLLSAVERAGVVGEDELAQAEGTWMSVLEHTPRGTAILDRLLARDAALFAQLVALVFRPRGRGPEVEGAAPLDDLARARATQAFRLLHEWRGLPGRRQDGTIDADVLRRWVAAARGALRESGHAEVGDVRVGEVLARVPAGADGIWLHEAVRELLEELQADGIDDGVFLGVVNGRGVTCRSPRDGGEQEAALAARYAAAAQALNDHRRTARVLRRLADNYRDDARREDDRRDLNEFNR